ncbi:MAG: hypothetical protein ACYC4R_04975 [Anaerolineae bacterium]
MWNRVLILVSGMAFGWTLVHYWTTSPDQVTAQRIRLIISVALAALVLVPLSVSSLAAGLLGLLLVAITALIAYAANARQIGKVDLPPHPHTPTRDMEHTRHAGVLLVALGEPETFDGPAYWAQRLRRIGPVGRPAPHWLGHPRAIFWVRHAYGLMGGANGTNARIAALAEALQGTLGEGWQVVATCAMQPAAFARDLGRLVEEGADRIQVVPIGYLDNLDVLREQVTLSRVREAGIEVAFCTPIDLGPLTQEWYDARLLQLIHGQAPGVPLEMGSRELELLRRHVLA